MSERVLIAYGSKHGSTAETADAIAGMLRERGLEVDVSEAARVRSIAGYDSVIVAGSLYTGRWHVDSRGFINRFSRELEHKRVAIFAMGPKTSDREAIASARQQLDLGLRRLPPVHADPVAVFGGVIRPERLRFPFSRLPASDARDWDAIRDFAAAVAARVPAAAV